MSVLRNVKKYKKYLFLDYRPCSLKWPTQNLNPSQKKFSPFLRRNLRRNTDARKKIEKNYSP